MQSIPFENGVLALFRYEPKEIDQSELSAFAYLSEFFYYKSLRKFLIS